jgi:putative acetyltransferase
MENERFAAVEPRIEKSSGADIPELCTVWEASVRATHDFLREEDILFYKSTMDTLLTAVTVYLVRDEERKIAGFLGVSAHDIEMLFIHPASRGRGVGKTLCRYAVHTLGLRNVDVNEQNEQAVGFYRHMGFVPTGRSDVDGLGKPYPIISMQFGREAEE